MTGFSRPRDHSTSSSSNSNARSGFPFSLSASAWFHFYTEKCFLGILSHFPILINFWGYPLNENDFLNSGSSDLNGNLQTLILWFRSLILDIGGSDRIIIRFQLDLCLNYVVIFSEAGFVVLLSFLAGCWFVVMLGEFLCWSTSIHSCRLKNQL